MPQFTHSAAAASEYLPALQSTHSADPDTALNFPGAHAEQESEDPVKPASQSHPALPGAESELASQSTQSKDAAAEYLPASQLSQASDPADPLYLPASHAAHTPSDPVYPATQVQTVLPAIESLLAGQSAQVDCDVAPTSVEYVPAPQLSHAPVPGFTLKVPSPQETQGPPSGPDVPLLHTQAEASALAGAESEFDGQAWQVASEFAPTVLE